MAPMFKKLNSRRQNNLHIGKPTIDQVNLERSFTDDPNYGLKLLYDGADASYSDVDFVAVHGMKGHPLDTFTDVETGCCWLRDLLPLNFPHCRVLSYGYWADNLADVSTFRPDQVGELLRALGVDSRKQVTARWRIFICHSIGGLLVKRALIEAQLHPQFVDVYKYTSGIVFLGTPHQGSLSADLALTLTKIIRVFEDRQPDFQNLFGKVQRDLNHVNRVNQRFFLVAAESVTIGSFYETKPTKHNGILLERSSAILNCKSEVCISLDANHAQLCKFRDLDDLNYNRVLNIIIRFREIARLADNPLDGSPTSLSASPSQRFLIRWIPCIASGKATSSMGQLEMAGSMGRPNDYKDAEMDIIHVHGLRGSPVCPWINTSPQTMWLRDILQVNVSTSRVMSYRYGTGNVLRLIKFDLDTLAKDLVDSIIDARAGIQNTAVCIALR